MQNELLREITILTSRASGPGGQHVNKTETKVELHWNLEESRALSDEQKAVLRRRLGKRLSGSGLLILSSQKYRSQIRNREDATTRFLSLIDNYSRPPKKRIRTRPTKTSVEKRIRQKKALSEKKRRRKGE